MFATRLGVPGSIDLSRTPIDSRVSPRMMFALREQLEEEGLGSSLQAQKLDRTFLSCRQFFLEEMRPLFLQMDKSNVARTTNPRFWWWNLDNEKMIEEISLRLGSR